MSLSWIPIVLVALHWSLVIGLSLRILMRRRPRGTAFAWIMLMFAIPYVGVTLYLIVGEVWLPRRRLVEIAGRHRRADGTDSLPTPLPTPPGIAHPMIEILARLAWASSRAVMTTGNSIEILDGAKAAFERIAKDIDDASERCYLLSYIWDPQGATHVIAEALARAAQRGVDCRVLVDAHGSEEFFRTELPARLRAAGVQVTSACPNGWLRLQLSRIDLRNHRKILVIDSRVAYTGSLNVADPAVFKMHARVGQWVDCAVRVTGPAVAPLEHVFLNDWRLEHPDDTTPQPVFAPVQSTPNDPSCALVVPSGPGQDPYVLRQMLHTLIYAARREVVLTTPYFVPDEATLSSLITVARGGVRVRLVVPEKVDAKLVAFASRSYFQDLLDAGIEIHQYRGGLLHAKTATIDGTIGMVGSANMDLRSFELNLEVSLFVFDPEFAGRLLEQQEHYLTNSTRINPEAWASRSLPRRMAQNIAQLVAPIL